MGLFTCHPDTLLQLTPAGNPWYRTRPPPIRTCRSFWSPPLPWWVLLRTNSCLGTCLFLCSISLFVPLWMFWCLTPSFLCGQTSTPLASRSGLIPWGSLSAKSSAAFRGLSICVTARFSFCRSYSSPVHSSLKSVWRLYWVLFYEEGFNMLWFSFIQMSPIRSSLEFIGPT